MNILIFGGTGTVGSQLILRFLKKKYKFVQISRRSFDNLNDQNQFHLDLGTFINFKKINFDFEQFDIIIYLAYSDSGNRIVDEYVTSSNLINFYEYVLNKNYKLQKFIFFGSIRCYDHEKNLIINEESPKKIINSYTKNKIKNIDYFSEFSPNFPIICFHPSMVFNESKFQSYKRLLSDKYFLELNNFKGIANFIYIEDLVDLLENCINQNLPTKFEEFIVNGPKISYYDFFTSIEKKYSFNLKPVISNRYSYLTRSFISNYLSNMGYRSSLIISRQKANEYKYAPYFCSGKVEKMLNTNLKTSIIDYINGKVEKI